MSNILLVDDEKSLRITLSIFLKNIGHIVQLAECVTEAKKLIDKKEYDLILTDILMDDGSGIDVLKYCKEKYPCTQVILITGYPNLDTATEALRLGAYEYLTKPILKDSLLKGANSALEYHKVVKSNEVLIIEAKEARKQLNSRLRSQKNELDSLNKFVYEDNISTHKNTILDTALTQVSLPKDCLNLEVLNKNIVKTALSLNDNNKQKTARYLCTTRDVLRSKLKNLDLE